MNSFSKFFKGYWNIMTHGRIRDRIISWLVIVLLIMFIGYVISITVSPYAQKTIPTSEFMYQLESNNVSELHICSEDGSVSGEFKEPNDDGIVNFKTTVPNNSEVFTQVYLDTKDTEYDFSKPNTFVSYLYSLLLMLIQVGILVGAIFFLFKSNGMMDNVPFFNNEEETKIEIPDNTFDDVVGIPEAKEEMQEIVAFLKNPTLYDAAGAKFPRGVLLEGGPGCGKTLLARCLAGEAGVPFIATSGSEFVEMYVGVGAKRIRQKFKVARQEQPAILFIDEIDAIGGDRDGRVQTTDEHLQTINQLLTEMDGFNNTDSVIVIAATNRAETLDPALLRPGRFDRIITVDSPAKEGRKEILMHYAEGRPFATKIDFDKLASHTYGFSGAQLESVMNQAATLAARRSAAEGVAPLITEEDLDEGISRVISGQAMTSKKLSPTEKKITAYHEAGHAVAQYFLPGCDPVQKISIVSRRMPGVGTALGYVQSYSEDDSYVTTADELRDEISALLAGRVSEKYFCDVETAGASNDLERATQIAYQMIDGFAFDIDKEHHSWRVALRDKQSRMLIVGSERQNYIDQMIEKILEEQSVVTLEVIKEHIPEVELIVKTLLEKETISSEEITDIMRSVEKDRMAIK